MPTLFEQMKALFDARGWSYRADGETETLLTGFSVRSRSIQVAFCIVEGPAMLAEALGVALLEESSAHVPPTLA